jgi:serine/threonine protein kinase
MEERDKLNRTIPLGEMKTRAPGKADTIMDEARSAGFPDGPLTPEELPDFNTVYEISGDFAEGGCGKIYLARDKILRRFVAVKSLREDLASSPSVQSRFLSESRITAQLDHPNIIPIYSLGRSGDDGLMLAMKLIKGKSLREHINDIILDYKRNGVREDKERESLAWRLEIFLRVCDAAAYAHSRDTAHCDLKPENVLIGEFHETYVMDWGIAKKFETCGDSREPVVTDDGAPQIEIEGTPAYMAPERLAGKKPSPSTDVFSLGMILFELTTLLHAVEGSDVDEISSSILSGDLSPVRHRFPSVKIDRDLRAVIEKARAYDPADRHQSAEELAGDVRKYMRFTETSARPDSHLMKIIRWMYHHKNAAMMIITATILALSAATTLTLYQKMELSQKARKRESLMSALFFSSAATAMRIDRYMLHLEDIVSALASKSAHVLTEEHPAPGGALVQARNAAGLSPQITGLSPAPAYNREISLREPFYLLPPGMSEAEAEPPLRALAELRRDFISALRTSIPGAEGENIRDEDILSRGMPLKWIYIGLKNGIFIGYPGKGGYPADYDPRKRPWYIEGISHSSAKWGAPYIDVSGQGVVLPCSAAITDWDGNTLGVAALDMTFDYVFKTFFKVDKTPRYILEKIIIDNGGRVIISSKMEDTKLRMDNPLKVRQEDFQIFPDSAALKRILRGKAGGVTDKDGSGGNIIYTYTIMPALSWFYIEVIDMAAAMKTAD